MNSFSDFRKDWIDSISPNEPFKFERRIDWDNISEEQLYQFSQSPDYYFSSESLDLIRNNVSFIQNSLFEYSELPLTDIKDNEHRSFVDLWEPLTLCVPRLLLDKYPNLNTFCSPNAISNIVDLLINRLVDLSDRLLWNQYISFRKPGVFFMAQIQIQRQFRRKTQVPRPYRIHPGRIHPAVAS